MITPALIVEIVAEAVELSNTQPIPMQIDRTLQLEQKEKVGAQTVVKDK